MSLDLQIFAEFLPANLEDSPLLTVVEMLQRHGWNLARKIDPPSARKIDPPGFQNGRSGQERQACLTRLFGPSLSSSTHGSGSSRHSSRKSASGGSDGLIAPPSSARLGRSGSTR